MNLSQATYAAIDKNKKKQVRKGNIKHTTAEKKGPPISPYTQKVSSSSADKGAHASGKDDPAKRRQKSLDDMYASDHKDQEKVNSEQESNPLQTGEELHTAVKKKPQNTAPMNETILHGTEDLYTVVIKKPKESSTNSELAPPIPSHTTEELYTAVQKKPKGSAMEDEEEAPPIPPHTEEDAY